MVMQRFGLLFTLTIVMSAVAQPQDVTDTNADKPRFLVVYDSSNSMWGELADKSRKYEAGRNALSRFLENELDNRDVAFRAYGHRDKTDCRDSELIVPFSDARAAQTSIRNAVNAIRPTGKTPITYSLQEGLKDFDGRAGDILLISDGIETCDADPCELMREWRAANVNIRVHVVGVGLNDMERAAMSCIASVSGGGYFDADSEGDFSAALTEAGAAIEAPVSKPDDTMGYALIIKALDSEGRSYVAHGKLYQDGIEIGSVTSNGRNRLEGPGNYDIEVGPVLRDGSIYKPVRVAVSVETPGDTKVEVLVTRPAVVSAKFIENGEEHRGSFVTSYQDGEKAFGFRAFDEALARPGTYEFKATPNADNELALTETLVEGEHTEVVFDLTRTVKIYVVYKLPNGEIIKRHSELWRDGAKAYSIKSGNGALARPGVYELRSDDQNTPLTPTEIEVTTDGQTFEVPLDAGFVIITYARSDDSYVRPPDRSFIAPLERTSSSYARLATPIHVAPGPYRIDPQSGLGFFDPQEIEVQSGETVRVEFTGKPLGQIVVNYAPSDNYKTTPNRAFVYPLDGQGILSGYMPPGQPKKFLPGRYRVEGWSHAGDIVSQEINVTPRETTNVTLMLRSEQ